MATSLDKDKLHDVLDQAVVVIDEQDLERSRSVQYRSAPPHAPPQNSQRP